MVGRTLIAYGGFRVRYGNIDCRLRAKVREENEASVRVRYRVSLFPFAMAIRLGFTTPADAMQLDTLDPNDP